VVYIYISVRCTQVVNLYKSCNCLVPIKLQKSRKNPTKIPQKSKWLKSVQGKVMCPKRIHACGAYALGTSPLGQATPDTHVKFFSKIPQKFCSFSAFHLSHVGRNFVMPYSSVHIAELIYIAKKGVKIEQIRHQVRYNNSC
jgi:hypothetical protein